MNPFWELYKEKSNDRLAKLARYDYGWGEPEETSLYKITIDYVVSELCCGSCELGGISFNFSGIDKERGLEPLIFEALLWELANERQHGWAYYSNNFDNIENDADNHLLIEMLADGVHEWMNPVHDSHIRTYTFNLNKYYKPALGIYA